MRRITQATSETRRRTSECRQAVKEASAEARTAHAEFREHLTRYLFAKNSKRKRVLVVDDDPADLAMIALALRDESYDLVEAPTGRVALALLQAGEYDAAVVDIYLPDLSGPEIIEQIRTTTRRPLIPVIAVTAAFGVEAEDPRRAAQLSGAHAFLSKGPFSAFRTQIISELCGIFEAQQSRDSDGGEPCR